MTQQSFALAQQAADTAYAMTLADTGDMAQASDEYKSVMTAYHAAQQQPDYGPDFYAEIITARIADAANPEPQYISLPDMMLQTGRINHAGWMELIWPMLQEIEY